MTPGRRTPACPICGRPTDPAFRPFCSQRCADVDLGRWLNERYVIPDPEAPDEAPREPEPDA
ncbi:DNA gyrase inhibitor YacG [Methylobacterium sp. NEAU 140]|uniref:DNA gyrase inhibitor YacG n=1 Tax=Methylobacterium sp. NEAU 140 TaxID=3064945 RepID=UPI002733FF73|nr:DNA gyrase inhibitor YacG [Methylobacterium sp. NEAU 140]MDP4026057.1 DNA gyrase inhibitor YacG [Methylobacterium sp. NEAU 140]